MAGFTLVRVEAVVNEDVKVAIFENYLGRMRRLRENIAAYNADIGLLSGPQMRVLNAVREEYHERSPERPPLEARTLYVFHGPQVGAVDGICLDGLEAVRALDPGYFGAGAYTSLNVEYAARYAMGEFDDQPLQRDFTATGGLVPVIMFAAAVNMAHPVTPDVDCPQPPRADRHSRFFGQPLSAGFDSHVACVSERAGFEAVQREHCEYVELVVANYQQLLPLAVLWLQPM